MKKNNEEIYKESLYIQNAYEIFTVDPACFQENLLFSYSGSWNEGYFYNSYVVNLSIYYYEDKEQFIVKIIKEGVVLETWVRKKVIPSL